MLKVLCLQWPTPGHPLITFISVLFFPLKHLQHLVITVIDFICLPQKKRSSMKIGANHLSHSTFFLKASLLTCTNVSEQMNNHRKINRRDLTQPLPPQWNNNEAKIQRLTRSQPDEKHSGAKNCLCKSPEERKSKSFSGIKNQFAQNKVSEETGRTQWSCSQKQEQNNKEFKTKKRRLGFISYAR